MLGYIVYVGTESHGYTRAFDVGNRTSFVYPHALPNRRHFFAVAAYSSSFLAGELSKEVSGFGRLVPPAGYIPDFNVTPLGTSAECISGITCLEAATVSVSARPISALTSTDDGRIWFVEDKQRIFTIDLDGNVRLLQQSSPRNRDAQVDGLALDPRFGVNRRVYVEATERLADGSRELIISKYREVSGQLRERTDIVSGIRLPATGRAPFTVDGDGRIFVAVPRDRNGARPHDGVVFVVDPQGRYPKKKSEPMSWRGLSNPRDVLWDAAAQELWLSGTDATGAATILRLPVSSDGEASPRTADDARRYLFLPSAKGRLLRIDRQTLRAEQVSLGSGEDVTAVSDTGRDVLFAITRAADTSGSRIVAIPLTD